MAGIELDAGQLGLKKRQQQLVSSNFYPRFTIKRLFTRCQQPYSYSVFLSELKNSDFGKAAFGLFLFQT